MVDKDARPTEYIFSGSLPENASTYVTRSADGELYEGLKQGKFCYVLNTRQSGKSSLRVRTMQRLREDGVECAAIDLSAGGIQNVPPEQWYADLIDTLIESFNLDVDFGDWWSANQELTLVTRFRKFIEGILLVEIKENIVIFIDEIDSVLSLKFPTDDFFAFIRACYNRRVDNPEYNRLTFCLLGVASPSNLIEDKQRTPFNIGQAISLKGFQLNEVEPLIGGLQGKFSEPRVMMEEILDWTGGQPFLTQKLCQFMLDELEQENLRTVEEVVKSRIIESWESQDEPEHLRTIRTRILRDEKRAAYLLELYQQIWSSENQDEIVDPPNPSYEAGLESSHVMDPPNPPYEGGLESSQITADNTIEQSELLLSGLVARREGKLRVYNRIYQDIFNQNWVENELKNLRPYSESFKFWVASGGKDESRLLRGKALAGAEKWARDKNLSYQDKQFLAASREKEIQEKIAVQEKEAIEKRNQVLSEANKKAKKRIRYGTVVLIVALLGAVSLGVFAAIQGNKALEAQKKLEETYTYVASPQQLKELASKFPPESKQEEEISKQADIKIKNLQLEQVFLHASKSLAYQHLKKSKYAEESIKQSMKFLKGWEHEHDRDKTNHEYLQTKIFALSVQGNLLNQQNNTQTVTDFDQEGFNILQESKSNRELHKRLIEFLASTNREYLKNYYLDELNNLLANKKWEEADRKTGKIILYLTVMKEQDSFFESDSFSNLSCQNLEDIDSLWVKHSNGRFGFRVQKQIWLDTGNRLGIMERTDDDFEAYRRFASRVGWYTRKGWRTHIEVIDLVKKDYQQMSRGTLPVFLHLSQPFWPILKYEGMGEPLYFFVYRLVECNKK